MPSPVPQKYHCFHSWPFFFHPSIFNWEKWKPRANALIFQSSNLDLHLFCCYNTLEEDCLSYTNKGMLTHRSSSPSPLLCLLVGHFSPLSSISFSTRSRLLTFSSTVLANRTSCKEGNVLYLFSPTLWSQPDIGTEHRKRDQWKATHWKIYPILINLNLNSRVRLGATTVLKAQL